jgi:hypothetical protein
VSTYTGPVAGLGSIIVNGVRFETVGAFVHDGDDPYGSAKYQSVIGLGTTVAVAGNVDEKNAAGSASDIRIVGGLRGKITGIDLQLGTLRVNDQLVKVTNNTVFDGNTTTLAGYSSVIRLRCMACLRPTAVLLQHGLSRMQRRPVLSVALHCAGSLHRQLRAMTVLRWPMASTFLIAPTKLFPRRADSRWL